MIKYYPLVHPSKRYMDIKNAIINNIDKVDFLTSDIASADFILVLGGDGYMLEMIKLYHHHNKPFVGINCGTLGFLMNDIHTLDELPRNSEDRSIRSAKFIKSKIIFQDGHKEIGYAANDVCIGNSIFDYYNMRIENQTGGITHIKGTGLVISNNFGSTSYRLNLGGPLIPTSSDLLGVIGIGTLPFKFNLYKPQNLDIYVEGKSSCKVALDGYSHIYDNIKSLHIQEADKSYRIGFLLTQPIESKRILMAENKIGFHGT